MTPIEHARLAIAMMPVRALAWLLGLLGFLVFAASALGCIATWPAICPLVDGERACKGVAWRPVLRPHPTKPRPACVVRYTVDGVELPITVEAEDCGP